MEKITYLSAFMKLAKLRIIFSVVFTGFAGMLMARRDLPTIAEFFWIMGALALSSAGAAIMNNLLDTEIDASMPRTRARQLAIKLWGTRNLWFISFLMVIISLVIPWYFKNLPVVLLIITAVISYALWYTLFLKRRGPFGAILGGLPGALPVLIGGYGVSYRFAPDIWLLFIWMILWQPAHFWALALKIKEDYKKANIPVLPVVFGNEYTKLYIYIYGYSLPPVALAIHFFGGYSLIYGISAVLFSIHYVWVTYRTVKIKEQYGKAFGASLIYMMGLMLALIIDIIV